MPVRSLRSSVLRWPRRDEVDRAVRAWAERVVREHPEVLRISYFGSYARGDWGVGSDLDIVMVVERSDNPFIRRAASFPSEELPVPADLLVYTPDEWRALPDSFRARLERETIWVYERSVGHH